MTQIEEVPVFVLGHSNGRPVGEPWTLANDWREQEAITGGSVMAEPGPNGMLVLSNALQGVGVVTLVLNGSPIRGAVVFTRDDGGLTPEDIAWLQQALVTNVVAKFGHHVLQIQS